VYSYCFNHITYLPTSINILNNYSAWDTTEEHNDDDDKKKHEEQATKKPKIDK
jgi:hypothetical protein